MSFHSVPTSARGHILSADFHNDADCSCYHQSSPNALSIEIPDSQEDTAPSPDLEAQPHAESPLGPQKVNDSEVSSSKSSSGDTEINTEYSAPEIEVEYRFFLHQPFFDVNGCVPTQSPAFHMKNEDMEEEPTQPATQQFVDPRRLGTKSMLSLQDEADVLCILLPTSGPALKAVDLVTRSAPQHILQNHWFDGIPEASYAPKNEDTRVTSPDGGSPTASTLKNTSTKLSEDGVYRPGRDIALRMSSKLHDPRMGFVFGRNLSRCDIVLSTDVQRLSNCHFRIYVNQHGVLMLEDTSTNGTFVDTQIVMRSKVDVFGNPCPSSHTIVQGSMISMPVLSSPDEEWIRFIVRMPSRNNGQQEYQQNLAAYLRYIQQAERQAQVAAAAKWRLPPAPPVSPKNPLSLLLLNLQMPFNPLNQEPEEGSSNPSFLAAATGEYSHGMHWNGGDKYNVVGYIGKGAFAMVYKISTIHDGEVYAAKQIEKRRFIKDGQIGSKVHHEISIMERLRHPNIVQFIEYQSTPSHIYIIMEYVPMGDLTTYTGSGTAMNEYMGQVLASQICAALQYLHGQNITHRDIKPDNILMASHQPYTFKLSDFGLSKIVKDEETFMKTFCGTILYCAPEIYPGFQRMRLGMPQKRTRHGEQPRDETKPYNHSVDTWGIAAVLFHLLCGRPAWTGTTENQGAVMLENIMNTPVEWERLEQAGVSEVAIDFLRRMLDIEPTKRATEDEQLRHKWIQQILEKDGEKQHEGDLGIDASQLSLADDGPIADLESDSDGMGDPRESKRMRGWHSSPPPVSREAMAQEPDSGSDNDAPPWGPDHPAWDLVQRQQQQAATKGSRPSGANRLFGEISASALQSSGVLGHDANAALDIPIAGSQGGYSNISSVDSNYPGPEAASANLAYNSHAQDFTSHNGRHQQGTFRQPQAPLATSLFGTEALVDQLNMASTQSGISDPSANSSNAPSPSATDSLEISTSQAGSKRSSHHVKSSAQASTPKKAKVGAHSNPVHAGSLTETPSRCRSSRHAGIASGGVCQTSSTLRLSHTARDAPSNEHGYNSANGQKRGSLSQSTASLLPTTFNSEASEEIGLVNVNDENRISSRPTTSSSKAAPANAFNAPGGPVGGNQITLGSAARESPFKEPPFRFGNLTPVAGSVPTVTVRISSRFNSFGRDPSSTFPHPDLKADRVPKNAIDITMWYLGIDQDVERGSTNWHLQEDLSAMISTRTSRYIKVNGVRLMRGTGCWYFGKLHTGDIVTVFEPPEGREPRNEMEKQFLKFRCEFFVGASKGPRSEEDPFVVVKEEQFSQHSQPKQSQGESAESLSSRSQPSARG